MPFSCFRVGKRKKGDFNILFNTKHEKTLSGLGKVGKTGYFMHLTKKLVDNQLFKCCKYV